MNTVSEMSSEDFKNLLTLFVESERQARGIKTSTSASMANYLKVLNGDMTLDEFCAKHPSPFSKHGLLNGLGANALFTECYIRAFTEAGLYVEQT